jgi:hypothetical protein
MFHLGPRYSKNSLSLVVFTFKWVFLLDFWSILVNWVRVTVFICGIEFRLNRRILQPTEGIIMSHLGPRCSIFSLFWVVFTFKWVFFDFVFGHLDQLGTYYEKCQCFCGTIHRLNYRLLPGTER